MYWIWFLFALLIIAVMTYLTHDHFGLWPSLGFFSLVISAAYYFYRQDIRSLNAIMQPVATRYRGTLSPATMTRFPRLHFKIKDRFYSVHALPTAGANALPGPFTSVRVTLPFDSALHCEVKRKPALVRGVIASLAPEWQATTGNAAFDKAFRLGGRDQTIMANLLNDDLRARLLSSQLLALHLRLADNIVNVFIDGLPKKSSEIEEMISLATALSDRCTPK